jgi:hypothetical protein
MVIGEVQLTPPSTVFAHIKSAAVGIPLVNIRYPTWVLIQIIPVSLLAHLPGEATGSSAITGTVNKASATTARIPARSLRNVSTPLTVAAHDSIECNQWGGYGEQDHEQSTGYVVSNYHHQQQTADEQIPD